MSKHTLFDGVAKKQKMLTEESDIKYDNKDGVILETMEEHGSSSSSFRKKTAPKLDLKMVDIQRMTSMSRSNSSSVSCSRVSSDSKNKSKLKQPKVVKKKISVG